MAASSVSPTGNVTGYEDLSKTTSTSPTASSVKSLGKDDFLQMLIAQMKSQDPSASTGGTDFSTQLAQYSQIEPLSNMTPEIQNQSLSMNTSAQTQAVAMIGKTVTVEGGNTLTTSGGPVDVGYSLAKDAAQVEIDIRDQSGNLVKAIDASDQSAGGNQVTWDASTVPDGTYTYAVAAKDSEGNSVDATTLSSGTVSAVQFKNNQIYAIVNDQEVSLSSITPAA